jgi:hypothetical protein
MHYFLTGRNEHSNAMLVKDGIAPLKAILVYTYSFLIEKQLPLRTNDCKNHLLWVPELVYLGSDLLRFRREQDKQLQDAARPFINSNCLSFLF